MTIDEMRQRVEQLLAQIAPGQPDDLHVHWINNRDDALALDPADVGLFELHLPIIQSALDYATCLHEIGHLKGRYQGRKHKSMTRERWAWQLRARKHARTWTAEMGRDAQQCLALRDVLD
jgi:hypothetical protein